MHSTSSASASLLTTVTSPSRRSRARPSSARGSATRIRATEPSLGWHAGQGVRHRRHATPFGWSDVHLLERLLDGPQDLYDVALADGAQVADTDHLAGHLVLAARDHHAVLVVQQLAERLDVQPVGRQRGGDRVGAVALAGEELEPERLEPGLRGARQSSV